MTWGIEFLEEAEKDLKKLDHSAQIQILVLCAMSIEFNAHVATPHFGGLYGLKVSVAKIECHGVIAFLQPFQVYF